MDGKGSTHPLGLNVGGRAPLTNKASLLLQSTLDVLLRSILDALTSV